MRVSQRVLRCAAPVIAVSTIALGASVAMADPNDDTTTPAPSSSAVAPSSSAPASGTATPPASSTNTATTDEGTCTNDEVVAYLELAYPGAAPLIQVLTDEQLDELTAQINDPDPLTSDEIVEIAQTLLDSNPLVQALLTSSDVEEPDLSTLKIDQAALDRINTDVAQLRASCAAD